MVTNLPRRVLAPAIAVAMVLTSSLFPSSPVGVDALGPQSIPAPRIDESPGADTTFTYVAPLAPDRVSPLDSGLLQAASTFIVTYNGFTPEAQAAFQHAVDIWASIVQSPVPIRVTANWRVDLPSYVLAWGGSTTMYRDFANAPRANTYYVVALANARARTDLYSGDDISVTINANFAWYLGTDGNARSEFDLVTVALHEIGHGLGLFGSFRIENGSGAWGVGIPPIPFSYDRFVRDNVNHDLTDTSQFPNGSTVLASALTSDNLYFDGLAARTSYSSAAPPLFAPSPFSGSSISHLNDNAFPRGDANSLMTSAMSRGEVVHDPGPIVRGMLADMGWPMPGQTAPSTTAVSSPRRLRIIH